MSTNDKQHSMLRDFNYGHSTIEYQLILEERKNLAITVRPDKSVIVKAPAESTLEVIEAKLLKKAKWILKQINYFDKFHPLQPKREYVSGETHYYLGRQYRLRIKKSGDETVKLIGKFFIVKTQDTETRDHVKFLMSQWYADHAQLLLDTRAGRYIEKILGSDHQTVEIRYKYLKRRWGSCDPNGMITFNIELAKAPIQCIDYVIVHELCHLVHPNHDKAFYRLMRSILPDWEERKEKLELFGVR
ncbi:MAG: M48 family metallopeptidase [Anaerolineaceae bacterium]|nr:M48 family metallopeptidase [Anaerolineaceae bacterium]